MFDAGTVEARLTLDRRPFQITLADARREAAMFAAEKYEATLGADDRSLNDSFGRAHRRANEWTRTRADATLGVNDRPGRKTLDGFDEVFRRYSRSWGQQGLRARVTADIRRAQTNLRFLERTLEGVEGERRVRMEAEVLRARQRLEGLERLADSLGLKSPTISVGLRGQAAAAAQMLGLQRLADRLDGYNVWFRASVDQSLSRALPNLLGALEMQVMRYQTVVTAIAAVTMPVFYASLGAIPALASAAAGSVGALSITLGKGLVGAVAGAGVGLGLGGAALLAYGVTVRKTIGFITGLSASFNSAETQLGYANKALAAAKAELDGATRGTEAYRDAQIKVAFAQANVNNEQARMNALLDVASPNLLKLQIAFGKAQASMIRFGGTMADAVAPAILYGFSTFGRFEKSLTEGTAAMVRNMNDVAIAFMGAAAEGQNLRSITTILRGIGRAGPTALDIVASAAFTVVNVLAQIVPAGLSVLENLHDLADAAFVWSRSAKGQRDIARVWADLWKRGKDLWRVGVDLGVALWGVGRALDAAGTGDKLFGMLERGAKAFRFNMRAGGEWREAITSFMKDVNPLLDAGLSLGKEFARQFFRVAGEIINFREEGSKLTVLEEIFGAIERSLKPMADFFLYEFKNIGPLIGPLVEEISDWFSTMGKSQPEMKFFIRFLTNMMALFNSLPEDTQRNIARVIAYIAAFKALGGGAVLGGISAFVSSIAGIWQVKQLRANTLAVRGLSTAYKDLAASQSLASMPPKGAAGKPGPATAPTAGPVLTPSIDTSTQTKRRLGERLAGFKNAVLGFAGPLIIFTIAASYDYGGAKEGYAKAREDGKGMALAGYEGFLDGLKTVPIAGALASWADEKLGRVLGNKGRFRKLGGTAGEGIVQGIVNGMAGFPVIGPVMREILDDILRWWGIKSPSTRAWNLVGRPIAQGIVGGIAAALNPARILQRFGQIIRGLKEGAAQAVSGVVRPFSSLPGRVGGFVSRTASSVTRGASSIRNRLSEGAQQAVQGTVRFFSRLPGQVGNFVSRAASSVARGAQNMRQRLVTASQQAVSSALQSFGRFVQGVGRSVSQFVSNVARGAQNARQRLITGAQQAVSSALNSFGNFVSGVGRAMSSAGSAVSRGISNVRSAIVNGASNAVQSALSNFSRLASGLSSSISNAYRVASGFASNLRSYFDVDLYVTGQNVIVGFINGLNSRSGDLYNAARGIAGNFLQSVRNRLNEGSPSREAAKSGVNAVLGLIMGARRTAPKLQREASRIAGGFLSALSGKVSPGSVDLSHTKSQVEATRSAARKIGDAWREGFAESMDAQEREMRLRAERMTNSLLASVGVTTRVDFTPGASPSGAKPVNSKRPHRKPDRFGSIGQALGPVTRPPRVPPPRPPAPPVTQPPINVNPVVTINVPTVRDQAVAEETAVELARQEAEAAVRKAFAELRRTGKSQTSYQTEVH